MAVDQHFPGCWCGVLGVSDAGTRAFLCAQRAMGMGSLPWGLWALCSCTSLDEGRQTCSGPGEHVDHVFQGMTRERDLAQEQQGSVRPQVIRDDWLPALEPERRAR